MTEDHALLLAQFVIGLAFAISATSKLRDLATFRATVADLERLPRAWSGPAAALVVAAEAMVAATMVAGGGLLVPGFAGATALLLTFSLVIAAALRHQRRLSCNCFGTSTQLVTGYDIVRNGILVAVAGGGIWAQVASDGDGVGAAEVVLAALVAACLLLLLINLSDVARTLRRPFWVPP